MKVEVKNLKAVRDLDVAPNVSRVLSIQLAPDVKLNGELQFI